MRNYCLEILGNFQEIYSLEWVTVKDQAKEILYFNKPLSSNTNVQKAATFVEHYLSVIIQPQPRCSSYSVAILLIMSCVNDYA